MKDDHAKMLTRSGASRLVPYWQVIDWERKGILQSVGYTFATGEQSKYESWKTAKLAKDAANKNRPSVILRDEGMAGAHKKASPAAADTAPVIPTASAPEPEAASEDAAEIEIQEALD